MYINKPITRLAILIGAPGVDPKSKHFLPGVEKDLLNYKKFLISPLGGNWNPNEIISCLNPQKESLLNYISNIKADYTFTMFSGHGEMYENDKCTWIWINDNDKINECDLINSSKKQTNIIDSCRGFSRPSGLGDLLGETSRALKQFKSTREIFDKHITECEEGLITLYAAGENQSAVEDSDGSFFQQALISSSLKWSKTKSSSHVQGYCQYNQYLGNNNILDIKDSFDKAVNELKTYQTIQTPKICSGRRLKWFPFAVK